MLYSDQALTILAAFRFHSDHNTTVLKELPINWGVLDTF